MSRLSRTFMLLIAALTLAGCAEVRSLRPVGSTPVAVEPDEWTGTWLSGGGTVQIVVEDGPQGRLTLYLFDPEDEELVSCEVVLSGFEPWTFGNLRCRTLWSGDGEAELEPTPGHYLWGRVIHREGEIVFWPPDAEAVRGLVDDGEFPGEVDDDGNVTVSLGEEELAALVAGEYGVVFDWEDPLILIRVGR